MSTFVKEKFINDVGQTILPGSEVIYAATSWGSTFIRKGIYEGYYLTQYKYGAPIKRVRISNVKKYSWERGYSILEYNRIYKLAEMTVDDLLKSNLVNG